MSQGGRPEGLHLGGKRIVLAVTGGIAAYKVVAVARELTQLGADVKVIMTRSAQRFVGAQTFASLTNHAVSTELFGTGGEVPHVELARGADLFLVAPATANALAKMSHGISDDLFSATALTVTCPVVVAPAMHTEMWDNAATQANVSTLIERGVHFVGPTVGALSSGDEGPGRLKEPADIVAAVVDLLVHSQDLAGKRFVVTAGGTQEPIDPVRFIGNRSSGLMGVEIADEAARRGAKVTLVVGPTNVRMPAGVDVIRVRTAQEMRDEVVSRAGDADVIVKAAAVADWQPYAHVDHKLKKAVGPPDITLVPTPDILQELGTTDGLRKPGGLLVGFAAETEPDPKRLAEVAQDKRRSKGADMIVANDVSSPDSGFNVPTNRAVIADEASVLDVGLVSKKALARALIDRISARLVSGE